MSPPPWSGRLNEDAATLLAPQTPCPSIMEPRAPDRTTSSGDPAAVPAILAVPAIVVIRGDSAANLGGEGTVAPAQPDRDRQLRRVDKFQQSHTVLGFPWGSCRKSGNDQAGSKAALIAYYGLFALFPLLLLFTTILGYVLHGNEATPPGPSSTAPWAPSRSSVRNCNHKPTPSKAVGPPR